MLPLSPFISLLQWCDHHINVLVYKILSMFARYYMIQKYVESQQIDQSFIFPFLRMLMNFTLHNPHQRFFSKANTFLVLLKFHCNILDKKFLIF